jgi:glutathione S-transferase
MAVPGMSSKAGTKNEIFQCLTPHRSTQVPVLVDDNNSLALSESPAIMTYLCEKYGTTTDDEKSRKLYATPGSNKKALIDSYMHWHHDNTRFLAKYFQTKVRPDLKVEITEEDDKRTVDILTKIDSGWLRSNQYIGDSTTPSIADILAYGELSTVTMTKLVSVDQFENVAAWMNRMTKLPYHDDVHVALTALGDLTEDTDVPIAKRLGPATKSAMQALANIQAHS